MGSKVIFYTPWISEASNSESEKFLLSCNKNRTVQIFYVLNPSIFASIQEMSASLFVNLSLASPCKHLKKNIIF